MLDIGQLIDDYCTGPLLLKAAIQRTPADSFDTVPIPDMWSIRQVVCHVSDTEIVYVDRMKRILAEDNPTLFDADPDLFTAALHISRRDPDHELQVVDAVRQQMACILRACDIEDFQRTGVHSTDGPVTLETLLERITGHLPHHVAFIDQKLDALAI